MNKSLFTFLWHGVVALIVCLGFAFWLTIGRYDMGTRGVTENSYVLWSGWIAFALMVVVTLYALRKYIHRVGLSFETRAPVPIRKLERAEAKLTEIRRNISRGRLASRAEVVQMAERILKDEGVTKVARVQVRDGAPGEPAFVVEVLPTEPLGRVAKWMHAHVWYGVASGVIVLFHGGFAMVSPLGIAMNVLTYLVILTGIVGTFLWAFGPRWIMAKERDLSFEESYVLEAGLQTKIEGLFEKMKDAPEIVSRFRALEAAGGDIDPRIKAALDQSLAEKPELKAFIQDVAVLVGQRSRIIDTLKALNRIKTAMNWWRVIHIPASILLLAVVAIHIVSVWWY